MTLQVKFVCHDCQHVNRQELGMPGFKLMDCDWTTFSEAHRHMIQHPDHYIELIVWGE